MLGWQMLCTIHLAIDETILFGLHGTQILNWAWRLVGANIGQNVCIISSYIKEADSISIGTYVFRLLSVRSF